MIVEIQVEQIPAYRWRCARCRAVGQPQFSPGEAKTLGAEHVCEDLRQIEIGADEQAHG